MLTPLEAQEAALDELNRLRKLDKWSAAYKEARVHENPLLAGGRKPETEYYIIEFRQEDRTTGLMIVHALTGDVSVTGIQKPDTSLYRFHRHKDILAILAKRRDLVLTKDRDLPSESVADSTRDFTVKPKLFWFPCDQSGSPFLPFYVVSSPGRPDLYVRADGEVYEKLTHRTAGA